MKKRWSEVQIDIFDVKNPNKITEEISYRPTEKESSKLFNEFTMYYILSLAKKDNDLYKIKYNNGIELFSKKGNSTILVFKSVDTTVLVDFFSVEYNKRFYKIKNYYKVSYIKGYRYLEDTFTNIIEYIKPVEAFGIGVVDLNKDHNQTIYDMYAYDKSIEKLSKLCELQKINFTVVYHRLKSIIEKYNIEKDILIGLKFKGNNLIKIKVYIYPNDIKYKSIPTK